MAQPPTPKKRRARAAKPEAAQTPGSLDDARRDAAECKACPLWKAATQTVFGEGKARSRIMMVGEQPGDQEDRAGRPFVGPAGQLLDRALAEAGIDRNQVYVTNAVKHFKFEPRGKRRLHKKPSDAEIDACYRWLERELTLVAPQLVIALGATAARALLHRATPIGVNRGRLIEFSPQMRILITVHPSFLLRVPDEYKAVEYRRFVEDLKIAAQFLKRGT
jgi:DNA polymerase